MKENKYDNENFFIKYSQMERSKKGLQGAGEWHELKKILPDFQDKTVLDLGCGYGWPGVLQLNNINFFETLDIALFFCQFFCIFYSYFLVLCDIIVSGGVSYG